MVTLLKNGHDPNFKDTHGQTPLLTKDDVDQESKDKNDEVRR